MVVLVANSQHGFLFHPGTSSVIVAYHSISTAKQGVRYLEVVLQLLPPLLQWFGPQVGVPFAREVWSLDDFS